MANLGESAHRAQKRLIKKEILYPIRHGGGAFRGCRMRSPATAQMVARARRVKGGKCFMLGTGRSNGTSGMGWHWIWWIAAAVLIGAGHDDAEGAAVTYGENRPCN